MAFDCTNVVDLIILYSLCNTCNFDRIVFKSIYIHSRLSMVIKYCRLAYSTCIGLGVIMELLCFDVARLQCESILSECTLCLKKPSTRIICLILTLTEIEHYE